MAKLEVIGRKKALEELVAAVVATPIFGAMFKVEQLPKMIDSALSMGGLSLQYERGFGQGCNLSIDWQMDFDESARQKARKPLGRYKVTVNWSATHRDIVDAQAAILLYQQVTSLGMTIQSMANAQKFSTTDEG